MSEGMQTIRMVSPDGTEDVVEVPQELWDRFSARAKELGKTDQELFTIALDNFLKKEGY